MYISNLDIEHTVLGLLFDFRLPAGGRVGYAALVKVWPRTHLRHSDLFHAVQRLVRHQELALEDTADGTFVVLMPIGHAHAATLNRTRFASLMRRLRLALLPLARQLEPRPRDEGPRRRLADRVAPQI